MSLVELIVFIAIVGVAVAGVLAALDMSTRASASPLVQKQALAIAEALLEEVQLQPFSYCDPDDEHAATALASIVGAAETECEATLEGMSPETGEARATPADPNPANPFDNVNDYNGLNMGPGISSISGGAIAGLDAYSATVNVATQALGAVPSTDALLITVTVTGPASTTVVLDGYRTRYAPNALP